MNNPVKLEVLPEIFCQTPNQCYIFEKSITIMDELQKSLFRHLSVSSTSPSQSVRPSSSSVRNTFGVPLCRRLWNLAKRQDVIAVADMVADTAADMEVHMVADTEVDKVADMVADMAADMAAAKN